MSKILLPNNGWTPREHQKSAWKAMENIAGGRYVLNWFRRSGKDDICLHRTAVAAMERPATYWHMLPLYSQGRKAIWEAVNPHTGLRRIDEAFPKEIRKRTDSHGMTIEFLNGSMWHVVGSDNYNALVGSPPYGVVFSEWSLADPAAWPYIRPILDENGGWAVFIYTSRGKNHGYRILKLARNSDNWYAEQLRADQANVFTPEQLEDVRAEMIELYDEGPGDALYRQEYLCDFDAAVLGSYYSKLIQDAENEGRIASVPYDQSLPVETWWDLGMADAMSIWFVQRVGAWYHVIDYYENSGEGLPFYAKMLNNKGYIFSRHVMPHDIKVRELGSGKSRLEIAQGLGMKVEVAPAQAPADGVQSVRAILPHCRFDAQKTQKGVEALRSYHVEYDQKRRIFKSTPHHDWSSHASDAFRYGASTRAPAPTRPHNPDPWADQGGYSDHAWMS